MKKVVLAALSLATLSLLVILGCSNGDDTHDGMGPAADQVVISVSPADGAVGIDLDTGIMVSFDRAMDPDQVLPLVTLHRGWGIGSVPLAAALSWNAGHTQLVVQPTAPLDANTTYTLRVHGMMMDMEGQMRHPMLEPMSHSGMMMGGLSDDELRMAMSTGAELAHQVPLDLSGDVVLVADGGSGDIAVIDPASNTLVGLQPVDTIRFLHHLYLTPDRSQLIVSDPGENLTGGHGGGHGGGENLSRVVILEVRTLREQSRVTVQGVVHNGVVTPDGSTLLLGNAEHNAVHKYNFPALTPAGSYNVGLSPLEVTVTAGGQYGLVANNGEGSITRINLTNSLSPEVIGVGSGPIGAWIWADGQHAWSTNETAKSLALINIDPLRIDTTIALGFTPGQAFQRPGSSECYVANEDGGTVEVYDHEARSWGPTIPTGSRAHGIAFSPDGTKAFVTNEAAHTVSVIDCSTRAVVATIRVGLNPNGIIYRSAR